MRLITSQFTRQIDSSIWLTHGQVGVDSTLHSFAQHAANPAALAAMTLGSFAFKAARLGFLQASAGLNLTRVIPSCFIQSAAQIFGLGVEVSAFRAASHPAQNIFDSQGWWGTAIDFCALKTIGHLGVGRNILLTHLAQANAMVLGHEVSAQLGFTAHEQGSYLERLAKAEAANMALSAGMNLFGMLSAGRMHQLERSLERSFPTSILALRSNSQISDRTLLSFSNQSKSARVETLTSAKPVHFSSLVEYYRALISRATPLEDNPRDPTSPKRFWIARYKMSRHCAEYLREHNPHSPRLARFDRIQNEAGQALILSDIRYVVKIARRYRIKGEEFWDLVQEGCLGLLKAAEKFDFERKLKFTTYSGWWIRHSISRYIGNNLGSLRIPIKRLEMLKKVFKELNELNNEGLEKMESLEELAKNMDLSEHEIERLRAENLLRWGAKLEDSIGEDFTIMDAIADSRPNPEELNLEKTQLSRQSKILGEFRAGLSDPVDQVIWDRWFTATNPDALQEIDAELNLNADKIRSRESSLRRRLLHFLQMRGITNSRLEHTSTPLPPVIDSPRLTVREALRLQRSHQQTNPPRR